MGKSVCFTGHRPNKLYGYDLTDERYIKLYNVIKDYCKEMIEGHGYDTFYSGGALGLDTVAFIAINSLKKEYPNIKNILAIPFENQYIKWNNKDKERYEKMKALADKIIYVDKLDKYKIKDYKEDIYYPAKMQKRNEYIVDNSDVVISVWDRKRKGGTYNCIKYAEKLNKTRVNINPSIFAIEVLL